MGTLVYIGDFKIGRMDAQSQLVLGNCKIFRELGYTSVLIGNDASLDAKGDPLASRISVEEFDCYNVAFKKNITGLFSFSKFHGKVMKIIESYKDIRGLICYGSPALAIELKYLSRWCRRRGIPIIFNCVDLSSTAHGSLPERIIKTLDRKYKEALTSRNASGIIAVSSYIREHYRKNSGCPSVIIPPLCDTSVIPAPADDSHTVKRLIYTGEPFPVDGRVVDLPAYKDRIDLMIDLLCCVRDQVAPFCLDLYGLTKEQYLHVVTRQRALLEQHKDCIRFHGRVPHDEVVKAVYAADYSVMYRTRNRMTMAGFSTKLAESISWGIPVLFTDTSDYVDYLSQDTMGFLLDEELTENNKKTIRKALSANPEEMIRMKRACYDARLFDYRKYVERMSDFLLQLLEGERQTHV